MSGDKWTKADIVNAVYMQTGLAQNDIKTVYERIFSEIKNALVTGKTVELRGVGTFEARLRPPRKKARNPRTGEPVESREHRSVVFRPGRELREAVHAPLDKI